MTAALLPGFLINTSTAKARVAAGSQRDCSIGVKDPLAVNRYATLVSSGTQHFSRQRYLPSPVVHKFMQAGSFQVGSVHSFRQTPLLSSGIQRPMGLHVSIFSGGIVDVFVWQHILCPVDLQGRKVFVSSAVPLG